MVCMRIKLTFFFLTAFLQKFARGLYCTGFPFACVFLLSSLKIFTISV